jgi:hypothetical protein
MPSRDYRGRYPSGIPAAGDPQSYDCGPMEIHELEDKWTGLSPCSSEAAKKAREQLSQVKTELLKSYMNRRDMERPGDLSGPYLGKRGSY